MIEHAFGAQEDEEKFIKLKKEKATSVLRSKWAE